MPRRNPRRVVIGEPEDRGVRRGRFPQGNSREEPLGPVRPKRRSDGRIIVPTGDRRHMTKIREGTLDTTVAFSKRRLATLQVDPDAELDQRIAAVEEETEEIAEKLSGREEGADNASTEQKTAKVGVRRQRRKVGAKAPLQPSAKKAKPKARKKPPTKKVTKTSAKPKATAKKKPVKRRPKP